MSGAPGQFGAQSSWQEHHTPDGRAYYYNAATKVTQWTKPEEMMAPEEKALASQPWKEYTAEGGRKYWYNTETKQSSWEMPEAFKKASNASTPVPAATPFAQPAAQGGYDGGRDGRDGRDGGRDYRDSRDNRDHRDDRDNRDRYHAEPRPQAFIPSTNDPEYATPEEAEQAFAKLLRRSGVQSDWTWPDTVRAVAKDPQFRAIRDAKDRRAAFEKYCQDMVAQDKERAEERLAKLRADFETMLKRHPEITHYTRWKTARPMIEGETIFRSTSNENERRQVFEEYIDKLRKAHEERKASVHKSAMDGLIDLLPRLNLEAYTRWSDAQELISSTAPFQSEEKYRALTQFDILTAFQNHMKSLERAFNDAKQDEKNQKFRKERMARDAFKSLLASLRAEGKVKAGTTWSQVYPLIQGDDRYKSLAGNGGSTAQELFWDVVEEEERGLRGPRNDVLDVLQDKRFEITPVSQLEEFLSVMKDDRRTANIDMDILKLLFDRLRDKRPARRDDDRQSERQQRRAVDDLRSFFKRVEPPITAADTYDKVRPRLLKAEEFEAVASEDARRSAFERHVRRLRERDDDGDRPYRREDRMSVDREAPRRERDRSRGERSHRGGRPSRRSRSPEQDPYEADRRRAIAERERNHRKASMADTVMYDRERRPSPHRRDRERERDYDRPPRSRRDDELPYDRDQRRRRPERGGPQEELPYGDDRPASGSRRRRPEGEDDYNRRDFRDSKRPRKDRSRERTPARDAPAPAAPSASKDTMSGSEEGEIEE